MVVYHLHRQQHKDEFSKGYIGVTNNLERRIMEHFKYEGNKHLCNALKLYTDITYSIIFEGTEEECLTLEKQLRPSKNIGWNIAIGGGKPPTQLWEDKPNPMKGKTCTESHKRKISLALTGALRSKETKTKMKYAAKKRNCRHYDVHRGDSNCNWKGYVNTPKGVFLTQTEAAKACGISQGVVSYRVLSTSQKHKQWYFIKGEGSGI